MINIIVCYKNIGHIWSSILREMPEIAENDKIKTLADLNIGESAIISSVGDDCLDIHCHCLRLMELGFTPGQEVSVVAKSPFKDPLAVSVRGTIIALRSGEAECIKISLNGFHK